MGAPPRSQDLEVASIFFGLFLGLFFYAAMKVAKQTLSIWKRTQSVANVYLWMIWIEAVVNFIFALTTYMYLRGLIQPSLGYYFGAVFLWTIQTQLLLQIIANRVGLIMMDKRKSRLIKWILFGVVALVNISVFCIWIPALVGAGETFVTLNRIWERVEKSISLLLDLGLNLYFLYLVRTRLIAKGLTKYSRLFKFNAIIVVVSTSMDISLLGMLSLPNPYDYVQFSPIAYIVKLIIELANAELISKVVRSVHRVDDRGGSNSNTDTNPTSNGTRTSRAITMAPIEQSHSYFPGMVGKNTSSCGEKADGHLSPSICEPYNGDGIMKTVTTQMSMETDEDREDSSSTKTVVQEASMA